MEIVELKWVVENIERLTADERKILDDLRVVDQVKFGELHLSAVDMLKILSHCEELYAKYVAHEFQE